MSIASATRQAFTVEADEKSTDFKEASAQPAVDSALERIVQWIPSEAVGSYVALLGLFGPNGTGARWVLFVIGAALVVVFLLLNTALVNKRGAEEWRRQKKSGDPPKLSTKRVLILLGLTLIAYVAWACALPETPFLDWWTDATIAGGAAVIVLALLLPKLAELLNVKMPNP